MEGGREGGKGEDFDFDTTNRKQAIDGHVACLANAVGAVLGLGVAVGRGGSEGGRGKGEDFDFHTTNSEQAIDDHVACLADAMRAVLSLGVAVVRGGEWREGGRGGGMCWYSECNCSCLGLPLSFLPSLPPSLLPSLPPSTRTGGDSSPSRK